MIILYNNDNKCHAPFPLYSRSPWSLIQRKLNLPVFVWKIIFIILISDGLK